MQNSIQGNHKHLSTVVLFLKYEYATSYRKTSGDDQPHDRTPCACVMIFMETTSIWLLLFYFSSMSVCATSYRNTSGDDHPHDRTPGACTMAVKETTSIWLLLFYPSSMTVPLPTVTHLEMITHATEHPVHAKWYSRKPQALGHCCSIPQVYEYHFLP